MHKYEVIYADPPWKYNDRRNTHTRFSGGALSHYPVMSNTEIKNLPVESFASYNAMLFMWATMPLLPEAIDVMRSWGFTYKTVAFTWVKTNKHNSNPFFGIGYYTKSNAELCLLGTKGKVFKPAIDTVSQIIISPRREHSRKPDEARQRIELMYPTLTKIELFARQKSEGWHVFGNEVESDILLSA